MWHRKIQTYFGTRSVLQPDQKFSMSQKKIVHRSSEVIDAAHPNDWHGDPPQKTVHRTASLVPSTSWTSGRFDSLIRLPLHDDTVNQLSQAGRHRLQWTRGPWRAREGRCCSSRANGKPPASESGCLSCRQSTAVLQESRAPMLMPHSKRKRMLQESCATLLQHSLPLPMGH